MTSITFDEMVGIEWPELLDRVGEEVNHDPLPPGEYDVAICDIEIRHYGSLAPVYWCKSEVERGQHKGRKIWFRIAVPEKNPNAGVAFLHVVKCFGIDPKMAVAYLGADEAFARQLWARRAKVAVHHRTIDGMTVPQVTAFAPADRY